MRASFQAGGRAISGHTAGAIKRVPWFRRTARVLARLGYAAMGTLYVVIGAAAARAVRDRGAAPADFSGAVELMGHTLAGRTLRVAVVCGLVANAVALFARAWYNVDRVPSAALSRCLRAIACGSGVLYVAMACAATRLLAGGPAPDPGGDDAAHAWTSLALAHPAGRWALAAAGVGTLAYGGFEVYRAWHAHFDGALDLRALPKSLGRAAVHLSRLGMAARAVVLLLVGGLLVIAARQHDANTARGLGGALATLRAGPWGLACLALLAAGLLAYGAHNFLLAAFRRFRPVT